MENQSVSSSGFEAHYRDYVLKVNFAVGDAKLTTPLDTTIPLPLTVFDAFIEEYRRQKALYELPDRQLERIRPLFQELERVAALHGWRIQAEDGLIDVIHKFRLEPGQASSFSFDELGIAHALTWLLQKTKANAQDPVLKCQQCVAEIVADVASVLQSKQMTPPCRHGWASYAPKES